MGSRFEGMERKVKEEIKVSPRYPTGHLGPVDPTPPVQFYGDFRP